MLIGRSLARTVESLSHFFVYPNGIDDLQFELRAVKESASLLMCWSKMQTSDG